MSYMNMGEYNLNKILELIKPIIDSGKKDGYIKDTLNKFLLITKPETDLSAPLQEFAKENNISFKKLDLSEHKALDSKQIVDDNGTHVTAFVPTPGLFPNEETDGKIGILLLTGIQNTTEEVEKHLFTLYKNDLKHALPAGWVIVHAIVDERCGVPYPKYMQTFIDYSSSSILAD